MFQSPVQGLLKDTLQQIAERILSGTNGDISLVCPRLDNGLYRIEAHAGDFPAGVDITKLDYRAGQRGCGAQVAKTGKPRLVNDYLSDIPDSPFIESVKKVGARSMAAAPVGLAGDVIAVIYVISKTPDVLDEQDLKRLAAQATIVEIAIRNIVSDA